MFNRKSQLIQDFSHYWNSKTFYSKIRLIPDKANVYNIKK